MNYEHELEWNRLSGSSRSRSQERRIEIQHGSVAGEPISRVASQFRPKPAADLYEEANTYLASRGLSFEYACKQGWYPAWYNGPRIIVPCTRTDGAIWFQGRLIETYDWKQMAYEETGRLDLPLPKRWDSPHGDRGDALCILSGPSVEAIFVVEGPMDALAITEFGYPAVALLGATPSKLVIEHLGTILGAQLQCYEVIGIPDRDATGAWSKLAFTLAREYNVLLQLRWLPSDCKDIAAFKKEDRESLLADMIYG